MVPSGSVDPAELNTTVRGAAPVDTFELATATGRRFGVPGPGGTQAVMTIATAPTMASSMTLKRRGATPLVEFPPE
jgi:hypothetical protein